MMPKNNKPNLIKQINNANFGDWQGFAEEMQQGSDRSAAILGGVFVDEHLCDLLTNFFVDDSDATKDLLGVEKPLSTFAARTKIAYSLGLISKPITDDINVIRAIRNAFAHTVHGLSFNHERIVEECTKLQAPGTILPRGARFAQARITYIATVLFIAIYIQTKAENMKQERRVMPQDHVKFNANWHNNENVEQSESTDWYVHLELLPDESDPSITT